MTGGYSMATFITGTVLFVGQSLTRQIIAGRMTKATSYNEFKHYGCRVKFERITPTVVRIHNVSAGTSEDVTTLADAMESVFGETQRVLDHTRDAAFFTISCAIMSNKL